ncbi:MAG: hypothetical protein JO246_13185, partial [Frankiaceae bacterium]|nr:hypothetical protein [Frankiaceae bacterium]
MTASRSGFPLPNLRDSVVVVPPPETTPGSWAGAPSVLSHDGVVYLAYRLRRPIGQGRGYRNVVAASEDGVTFHPVSHVDSDQFGSESLERPALVVTPDGRWRLYVSCATPGTKHWRVDLVEATTPEGLGAAESRTVLPGDEHSAVKDPVVLWDSGRWHLWASVHPLDLPDHTDRMTTDYATSTDGIDWNWHGTVLTGTPGSWDARGVRATSVLPTADAIWMSYDGRASAAQNWEEVTGLAVGPRTAAGFGALTRVDRPTVRSRHEPGGLRYLALLTDADGSYRL